MSQRARQEGLLNGLEPLHPDTVIASALALFEK